MESSHIDNRKLSEVVSEHAVLGAAEIEHLSSCEECLELVRILVRQIISREPDR
jgi:hypothetical protein